MRFTKRLPFAGVIFVITLQLSAFAAPITLKVDASEAGRKIYHTEMNVPVTAGPFTLMYPKWLPGEHAPTGPITDLAGLKIFAGNKPVEWKRDSVELFAFHMTVPSGVSTIQVKFDFLSTPDTGGFTSGASATSELAMFSWNQLLLYPQGKLSDDVEFTASLKLPADWKIRDRVEDGIHRQQNKHGRIQQRVADDAALIRLSLWDSTSGGLSFRQVKRRRTTSRWPQTAKKHSMLRPELISKFRQLIKEAYALFGARHYREYHFLLAMSDRSLISDLSTMSPATIRPVNASLWTRRRTRIARRCCRMNSFTHGMESIDGPQAWPPAIMKSQ